MFSCVSYMRDACCTYVFSLLVRWSACRGTCACESLGFYAHLDAVFQLVRMVAKHTLQLTSAFDILQYLQDKTSFRRGLQCTLFDAFSCSFFCMLEKHKLQLVCAYGVRNMCETRQILFHRIDCISVAENTVVQVESLTFCHKTRKTLHC